MIFFRPVTARREGFRQVKSEERAIGVRFGPGRPTGAGSVITFCGVGPPGLWVSSVEFRGLTAPAEAVSAHSGLNAKSLSVEKFSFTLCLERNQPHQ